MEKTIEAGTMSVRGKRIDVQIRIDEIRAAHGIAARWEAKVGEETYRANSPEELYTTLMAKTKRLTVKISLPIDVLLHERFGNYRVARWVVTGRREDTHKILYRDERGAAQQSLYGLSNTYHPLTSEEKDELIRLSLAKDQAERALDNFRRAHEIDARKEVAQLLEQAEMEGQQEANLPSPDNVRPISSRARRLKSVK